ncbi:transposase [Streptomyces sp. NPDC002814]
MRGRAGAGAPAHLPARDRLVGRWTPDQGAAGVLPRTGQDLGLRRPAPPRRAGGHDDRPVPFQRLLPAVLAAGRGRQPGGDIWVVTDNLSSHNSFSTRTWLEDHPRIRHAFIPVGACWLNLQEGWWRLFRKAALAGQTFADPDEIDDATRLATAQLNARARPWIWGRPQPKPRTYRRHFTYAL